MFHFHSRRFLNAWCYLIYRMPYECMCEECDRVWSFCPCTFHTIHRRSIIIVLFRTYPSILLLHVWIGAVSVFIRPLDLIQMNEQLSKWHLNFKSPCITPPHHQMCIQNWMHNTSVKKEKFLFQKKQPNPRGDSIVNVACWKFDIQIHMNCTKKGWLVLVLFCAYFNICILIY